MSLNGGAACVKNVSQRLYVGRQAIKLLSDEVVVDSDIAVEIEQHISVKGHAAGKGGAALPQHQYVITSNREHARTMMSACT